MDRPFHLAIYISKIIAYLLVSSGIFFVFKGVIRTLLNLIGLNGFTHMHSPTNMFYDVVDKSYWEARIDLKGWK